MIPGIIHQTWKTSALPENLKQWHNGIKQLHPGWEIKLWTDKDNLELVKTHFPYLLKIYENLEYNIMRVDMVRYMYMKIYGGFYLDLDYEMFMPFTDEIRNANLMLPVSRQTKSKTIIGNCIFGSVPGHPFWDDVLEDLFNHPPAGRIYNMLRILKLTGPEMISRIYFKNPQKYSAYLPSKNTYHPPGNMKSVENYRDILLKTGSMGIHHCEGSWLATRQPLVYLLTKINSRFNSVFLLQRQNPPHWLSPNYND